MAKPIGNPNFNDERAMEDVDRVLTSIQDGYGLTRDEAVSCLHRMAIALTVFKPGDPGLQARFHRYVADGVDDFQTWAEKVNEAILSWGDET